MKRRLVQQGTSTLMVSLPAKWTKKHALKKGSEVDLLDQENELVITPQASEQKTSTEIKLSSLTESAIRTMITNTYRKGYDIIRVDFTSQEQFRILSQVVKTRLIGFDITKKEVKYCLVESITEPSHEHFENILQKVFLNIENLFTITKKRLEGEKDIENFEEVEERIQKYDNFCRRVMAKRAYNTKNPELLWAFLASIIHAQRELYHVNKIIKTTSSTKVKKMLEDIHIMFKYVERAYAEKNISIIEPVHDAEKKIIYDQGYKLLQEGTNAAYAYHLMSATRQFYLCTSPLLGLLLT